MTALPRGILQTLFRGIGLIARGRAEGLNCFGQSPRAFLVSLLPGLGLMAGTLADSVISGYGSIALTMLLSSLCALLAPPVLSYELARLWGREAFWNRYAVAFNWTRWLLVLLFFTARLAHRSGLVEARGFQLLAIGLAFYALWLSWFVARHGLALTGMRAALLVAGVNIGTLLLVLVPGAVAGRPG